MPRENMYEEMFDRVMSHDTRPEHCYNHPEPPLITINGKIWSGYQEDGDKNRMAEPTSSALIHHQQSLATENYINLLIAETEQMLQEDLHGRCMVGGKGLREGQVDNECVFYVETFNTLENGGSKVDVEITGTNHQAITCKSFALDENLYEITYNPCSSGYHVINIKWEGQHIIGSPFYANISIDR